MTITTNSTRRLSVTLIDNRDSFVYNLVDAFAVAGMECTVYRNTIDPQVVIDGNPDVICLSPGPGHPVESGTMMQLIDATIGKIPILGICLGFQALIEHFGGRVIPCGPVHGVTDTMTLTDAGAASGIFDNLTGRAAPGASGRDGTGRAAAAGETVPIARYHSLGCRFMPHQLVSYAESASTIGTITMAGGTVDGMAIGLQFHPESVLSPTGPIILSRCIDALVAASARRVHDTAGDCLGLDKPAPAGGKNPSMTQPTVTTSDVDAALVHAFLDNPAPSRDEVRAVYEPLTEGRYSDVDIAALLTSVRTRGITANDIAGAADAFLAAATPLPGVPAGTVDTCGTGGDGADTINVSTAAAFVAAAAGAKVVKHGNRSVSSKSGSADVLEALSIPIACSPEHSVAALMDTGFTFLFAPAYHPAIRHVMPVRKALKVPTIFNVLGPLLNPARPDYQVMGIADPKLGPAVIDTMRQLGRTRALVIHGNGIDEATVDGPTTVWELNGDDISHYELRCGDVGLDEYSLADLRGGDAQHNAQALRTVLAGEGPAAHRAAIAYNAGLVIYVAGLADTPAQGVARAADIIDRGAALATVEAAARAGAGE